METENKLNINTSQRHLNLNKLLYEYYVEVQKISKKDSKRKGKKND